VDPTVVEAMKPYFSDSFGNASSIHSLGQEAKQAMERSRKLIAKSIGAKPSEIVFTSGGTESNNMAIKGVAFARKKGHIITTKVDHDCVYNACKWLEKRGFEVTYLDVDKEGFVSPKDLEKAIRKDTILVSIIHGNNEIGTVQPLAELGKICRKRDVPFHSDACQSYTKVPIDVDDMCLDMLTINAHKIHGPKGVGALFIRQGTEIEPLLHGGGHERSLRSGTENIPGIVGFAKAVEIAKEADVKRMMRLRDMLIDGLLKIPETRLNGPRKSRLCNNVNVTFEFIEGEAIALALDAKGIAVSTGSACSSHTLEPSHVLLAIGLPPEMAHGSIRFTISRYTTEKDIRDTIKVVYGVVERLRKISPFKKKGDINVFKKSH
jgi:cysteine desulfurase